VGAGELGVVQPTLFMYAMSLKNSRFEEVLTKNSEEYSSKPISLFSPPTKCPQKSCGAYWPLTSFVECVEVVNKSRVPKPCPFGLTNTFAVRLGLIDR
jgi:hypothetical protein